MGIFRFRKQELGKGFGDFLEKEERERSGGKRGRGEEISLIGRIGHIGPITILFLGGVVLFGRLFYLTLTRGAYFRDLAENNRVREESVPAPRGVIYDREGRVLARNRPIYKLKVKSETPKQNKFASGQELKVIISREEALEREARGEEVEVELGREYPQGEVTAHVVGYLAEVTEEEIKASSGTDFSGCVKGLSGEQISESLTKGKAVEVCQERDIGYSGANPTKTSKVSLSKDLHGANSLRLQNRSLGGPLPYESGDWKGRSGVEEAFENVLRGVPGKRLVEVDAQGREIRELGRVEPVSGNNAYLSIDLNLQEEAAEAIEGNNPDRVVPLKGAVVVSQPLTGEILALYSSPSFDPNLFVDQARPCEKSQGVLSETPSRCLEKVLSDSSQPLFNRAISGLYPPGSTFKIITAAAGLETGAIDEKTTVEDTGVIAIGPYQFPNWYFRQYGRKEGEVDVVKAIQRSNDIFFYKVGEWLGIERLEKWAKAFGLNTKLGIEIAGEEEGIVRRSREWFLGDTYHLAIGQGDLLVTPLQVNSWASVIANGGRLCQPTVLNKTNKTDKTYRTNCQDIGLKEKTISLIREGMKKACAPAEEAGEVGGTGWPLFKFKVQSPPAGPLRLPRRGKAGSEASEAGQELKVEREIPVACKTGTAEYGDAEGATHAWLTAFAPASPDASRGGPVENPEIVVTVLVEGGGEGSSVAGPIVKKLLEEWFGEK